MIAAIANRVPSKVTALMCFALFMAPLAALADGPGPIVILSGTPKSNPSPVPPAANPQPAPAFGSAKVISTDFGAGATDQGLAIGGTTHLQDDNGSIAQLDYRMGSPVLLIRGQAEGIPMKLTRTDVRQADGDVSFDVTFAPASGDVQISLPAQGNPGRSHILITPQLAAAIGMSAHRASGVARLKLAPLAGGAQDGDGSAFALGAKIGWDLNGSYDLDDVTRLDLKVASDQYSNILSGLSGKSNGGSFDVRVVRTLETGQQVYAGLTSQSTRLDVLKGTNPNTDKGETTFVGVKAGMAW